MWLASRLALATKDKSHDIGWCPSTVPSNSSLAERLDWKQTASPASSGMRYQVGGILVQVVRKQHFLRQWTLYVVWPCKIHVFFCFCFCHGPPKRRGCECFATALLRSFILSAVQATRNVKVAATLEPSAAVNLEYLALALKAIHVFSGLWQIKLRCKLGRDIRIGTTCAGWPGSL